MFERLVSHSEMLISKLVIKLDTSLKHATEMGILDLGHRYPVCIDFLQGAGALPPHRILQADPRIHKRSFGHLSTTRVLYF